MDKKHIEDLSRDCGVPSEVIIEFIESEWIRPLDLEAQIFDQEDEARIKLIWELKEEFGVNEEGIPIILHLLDQLNCLHLELHKH